MIAALSRELDATYRAVAARLPSNPAVRIETVGGKDDLILTGLVVNIIVLWNTLYIDAVLGQ